MQILFRKILGSLISLLLRLSTLKFCVRCALPFFFYILIYCGLSLTSFAAESTPTTQVADSTTNSTPPEDGGESNDKADSMFLDNKEIVISNKPVLIVFSKDDCYYCQILETSLVKNAAIQGYLVLNFSLYFINIDSEKKHNIPYLSLSGISSRDMARLYKINALPLMVFVSTDSKEIMRVVGFPGEKRILRILEFINNDLWTQFTSQKERIRGFLEYERDESMQ